jgi:hypothetical protein
MRFWFIMHLAAKAPRRRRPVSSTLGRTTPPKVRPAVSLLLKHFALPTVAAFVVAFLVGLAYKALQGTWPALGYWLSMSFVYLVVVLPNLLRQARSARDNRQEA